MAKQIKIIFKCLLCLPFLFILSSCAEYVAAELAIAAVSSLNKSSYSTQRYTYNNKSISDPLKNVNTKSLSENLARLQNDSRSAKINSEKELSSLERFYASRSDATICTNIKNESSGIKKVLAKEAKRRGLDCERFNKKSVMISNQGKDPDKRPLAKYSDITICHNATLQKRGDKLWSSKNDNFVAEARYRGLTCGVNKDNKTMTDSKSKDNKSSISSSELEKEKQKRIALQKKLNEEERKRKAQEKRIADLEKKNKELQKPKKKQPSKSRGGSGSGFFISKQGHIITNEHVVKKCNKITVGDNIDRQVPARLIEVDRKNDLALLITTTLDLASSETKSLIKKLSTQKLGIEIVPLATAGLMRSDDVELGEQIVVAGFPYGDIFSKDIKVTFGNVNSTKGVGDDSSQFQIQAPVQIGNSGGPIYDKYGNIVGVVVAQLDKLKMAKTIGSLPENVNFGIKASTVKQFLNSSGLPTKWAERNKKMSDKDISQIASKQTVMVVCHR